MLHIPANGPCNLTALCHGLCKGIRGQALCAIAPCVAGIIVDFHLQTVGTGGHSGDHHRLNQIGLAGGDGLEVEVHYDPQHAWSDGAQCLTPDSFAQAMAKCRQVAWAIGRDM